MVVNKKIQNNTLIVIALLLWATFLLLTAVGFIAKLGYASELVSYGLNVSSRLNLRFLILAVVSFVAFYFICKKKAWRSNDMMIAAIMGLLSYVLDVVGNVFRFYSSHMWGYDKYVHFLGGVFITLGVFFWMQYLQTSIKSFWTRAFYAYLITFHLGVFFELYEFFSDKLVKTNMVNGIEDTIYDITLNMLGGLLALIMISIIYRLTPIGKGLKHSR